MTTSIDIRFTFPILIYYDILVDLFVIAVVIVLGIVGHLSRRHLNERKKNKQALTRIGFKH